MGDRFIPVQVNTAASISDPGQTTDAFGVREDKNIFITAATASFTANDVNIVCASGGLNFGSNNPLFVTGAVTNAQIGSIFYYTQ
tara:strand:+ start:72 stop:326 length:255 start_codon:yes stop_codon:yes gene_type:complete